MIGQRLSREDEARQVLINYGSGLHEPTCAFHRLPMSLCRDSNPRRLGGFGKDLRSSQVLDHVCPKRHCFTSPSPAPSTPRLQERRDGKASIMTTNAFSCTEYEHDPRWTAVDAYGHKHLHPKSRPYAPVLHTLLDDIAASGLPDDSTYPAFGKFLALQCRAAKAKNVLEVGLLGGHTTIWLASLNPDCRITCLEINPQFAEAARRNMDRAGVGHQIEIIDGPALETLPKLQAAVRNGQRAQFDFVFIDADKENNWPYMDMAVDISVRGATVIVDNVVRRANVVNDQAAKDDSRVRGARRTIENAGKDARVEACLMQQVSEKNYDGFLYAVVN